MISYKKVIIKVTAVGQIGITLIKLAISNIDCFFMISILLFIHDFRTFYNERFLPVESQVKPWWGYPAYETGFAIKGDGEFRHPGVQTKLIKHVWFPFRKKNPSAKVIVVHHKPLPGRENFIHQECRKECVVLFLESFYEKADAFVFSWPFPTTLPNRT